VETTKVLALQTLESTLPPSANATQLGELASLMLDATNKATLMPGLTDARLQIALVRFFGTNHMINRFLAFTDSCSFPSDGMNLVADLKTTLVAFVGLVVILCQF
jgi:hypothetical protein